MTSVVRPIGGSEQSSSSSSNWCKIRVKIAECIEFDIARVS